MPAVTPAGAGRRMLRAVIVNSLPIDNKH